ncbi:DNA methyltransferase, partial [Chloroflexota bacterium]
MRDNLDLLRQIEGFPIGEDKDLHGNSNPPYYTSYPNPHIGEYIREYGKDFVEATDDYHKKPFISDISEGKNHPIYMAHAYHTKVPHKAIMPFIEHYTDIGDIVFDGFCGTGMTGVAAQLTNRKAILCDLSPAATFIAYNLNVPVDTSELENNLKRILKEAEEECLWLITTNHVDGRKGIINYTVWSDVFRCPYCTDDVVYWEDAIDHDEKKFLDVFKCPSCYADLNKRILERKIINTFDPMLKKNINMTYQLPVLINYLLGSKLHEKKPEDVDLQLLDEIDNKEIPYWYPQTKIPEGDKTGEPHRIGISYIHQLYSKRNLW